MTLDHMDELIEAGVDSIKIEGRMRKPEYVIQTVKSYKNAIEHSISKHKPFKIEDEVVKLKKVFNREFTEGYLFNVIPKDINHNLRPNHMGIDIGKVIDFKHHKATIKLTATLSVNDGIRIIGNNDLGDHVSRILKDSVVVKKAEANDIIQIDLKDEVEIGSRVLKTTDSELETELNVYLSEHYKLIGLKGILEAFSNQKLKLSITDGIHQVIKESDLTLEVAIQSVSTEQMLYDQVTKLGQTPFFFESIDIKTDEKAFVSVKVINQLRRDVISELEQLRTTKKIQVHAPKKTI
jgi:putative protease